MPMASIKYIRAKLLAGYAKKWLPFDRFIGRDSTLTRLDVGDERDRNPKQPSEAGLTQVLFFPVDTKDAHVPAVLHDVDRHVKENLHGVFLVSDVAAQNTDMHHWRLRVEQLKEEKKWTYEKVAERYNIVLKGIVDKSRTKSKRAGESITAAGINHWVKGIREPSITQFFALAKALEVTPEHLLFGIVRGNTTVDRAQIAEVVTQILQADPGMNTLPPFAVRQKPSPESGKSHKPK